MNLLLENQEAVSAGIKVSTTSTLLRSSFSREER